jgi:uncharacterized membrane protein YkvA (DUF1232 family)
MNLTKKQLILIAIGFIYLLSPVDFIPDFVPGLGNLDDGAVLAFILNKVFSEMAQVAKPKQLPQK